MTALHRAVLLIVAMSAPTTDAAAQNRQLMLELSPVYPTIGFAWASGPTTFMGFDIGAGIPVWDVTLVPTGDEIAEIAHLGFFLRSQPNPTLTLDARVNAGVGGPRVDCSGCLPAGGGFAALGGGAFIGGRRVKVGARLRAGLVKERGESARFFMNLTPLALLFTYEWTHRPFPF